MSKPPRTGHAATEDGPVSRSGLNGTPEVRHTIEGLPGGLLGALLLTLPASAAWATTGNTDAYNAHASGPSDAEIHATPGNESSAVTIRARFQDLRTRIEVSVGDPQASDKARDGGTEIAWGNWGDWSDWQNH